MKNVRSLLEEFVAFAFRDPVVAAEMFTEDFQTWNNFERLIRL